MLTSVGVRPRRRTTFEMAMLWATRYVHVRSEQRAVESLEALPQRQVDVLQQIAPLLGIPLVPAREPAQGRAVGGRRLLVQVVLLSHRSALGGDSC